MEHLLWSYKTAPSSSRPFSGCLKEDISCKCIVLPPAAGMEAFEHTLLCLCVFELSYLIQDETTHQREAGLEREVEVSKGWR